MSHGNLLLHTYLLLLDQQMILMWTGPNLSILKDRCKIGVFYFLTAQFKETYFACRLAVVGAHLILGLGNTISKRGWAARTRHCLPVAIHASAHGPGDVVLPTCSQI